MAGGVESSYLGQSQVALDHAEQEAGGDTREEAFNPLLEIGVRVQLEAGAGDTDLKAGHVEVTADMVRADALSERERVKAVLRPRWGNAHGSISNIKSIGSSHHGSVEMNRLVSMRMQVRYLALLSGLRIQRCCELWFRWGSDPTLLWLWCGLAAAAPIRPLAWELPYAAGVALEHKTAKNPNIQNKRTSNKRSEDWGDGGVSDHVK